LFPFSLPPDNNNQYNQYEQEYELRELCEQSYEMAAKCETSLTATQYFFPDTNGCDYINDILPKLVRATRSIKSASGIGGGGNASPVLAVLFGLSTVVLGAYSFFLYRKIHRAKVNLSQADGALA
jgi:hypothetical protein